MEKQLPTDVLIIGAGIAGLSAAGQLKRQGLTVRILEKSRGVAGRAATKRLESGAAVDYGAPFFSVRNPPLADLTRTMLELGIVQLWQHGIPTWKAGQIIQPKDGHPRYAAKAGISAIGKFLRDGPEDAIEVIQEALVSAVWKNNQGYSAVLENGDIYSARVVIVNVPAPQALSLTRPILEPQTQTALEAVKFVPCWALMAALETDLTTNWQALRLEHPVLTWISLEHSKRSGAPTLVLHANHEWSTAHLETSSHLVIEPLIAAAREVLGEFVTTQILVHRWRYAQAVVPHSAACLAQDGLVFCGDWCAPDGNARIESAFESGLAAAAWAMNFEL